MTPPKLMLLSTCHPGWEGTGGMILADAVRSYPRDRLCCFTFLRPTNEEFGWAPTRYGAGLPEQGIPGSWPRLGKLAISPLRHAAWRVQIERTIRQAVRFGRDQRVDKVWGIAETLTNIMTIRRVAARLRVPHVVNVWDPPDYIAYYRKLDGFSTGCMMREFGRMMRGAEAAGVASPWMAEEFSRLYGTRCVVMWHGISEALWHDPASAPVGDGHVTVAYTGTLYARREFDAFLDAMALCDWRVHGLPVRLRMLTPDLTLHCSRKIAMEHLGYRPLGETLDIVSRCDISYVPYWFDPAYERAVRLSFPSKLIAALAAGRPVFYHGPDGSSPAAFLREHPAGFHCNSLEPRRIVESLERFMADAAGYARATRAGREALEKEFRLDAYVGRFAQVVGADAAELTASRPR